MAQKEPQDLMADVHKIKEEFIELHNQVPELISNDALEPLCVLSKDTNTGVDMNVIAEKLKHDLKTMLLDEFESMWKNNDVDANLTVLEGAKKKFEGGEKAWRPTGKTPQEQVQQVKYGIMKNKISFLENVINEQSEQLNKLMPAIETNRQHIQSVLEMRNTTLEHLKESHKQNMEEFEIANEHKAKIMEKLIDISLN